MKTSFVTTGTPSLHGQYIACIASMGKKTNTISKQTLGEGGCYVNEDEGSQEPALLRLCFPLLSSPLSGVFSLLVNISISNHMSLVHFSVLVQRTWKSLEVPQPFPIASTLTHGYNIIKSKEPIFLLFFYPQGPHLLGTIFSNKARCN